MIAAKQFFSILILSLSLCLPAGAFDVPAMSSPVVDQVGLLPASVKQQIEGSIFQFKQTHQAQIQVLIVSSLNDEPIENVAIQVFDKWKVGDEKRDDGILFLVAPKEKRMRIEVGQGLEGTIPDAIAIRIIADVVRPHFQREEYALGVMQGVAAIQSYIANEKYEAAPGEQRKDARARNQKGFGIPGKFVFIIVGILWFALFLFSPTTALHLLFIFFRGGGGGGGSGGSWGGGGGRSSGGGASGGW